jgi:hypothetical protein
MRQDVDDWLTEQFAVAEEATPEPWCAMADCVTKKDTLACSIIARTEHNPTPDAAFIAAARTGYPHALKLLKRYREALKSFMEKEQLMRLHGTAPFERNLATQTLAYDPEDEG